MNCSPSSENNRVESHDCASSMATTKLTTITLPLRCRRFHIRQFLEFTTSLPAQYFSKEVFKIFSFGCCKKSPHFGPCEREEFVVVEVDRLRQVASDHVFREVTSKGNVFLCPDGSGSNCVNVHEGLARSLGFSARARARMVKGSDDQFASKLHEDIENQHELQATAARPKKVAPLLEKHLCCYLMLSIQGESQFQCSTTRKTDPVQVCF